MKQDTNNPYDLEERTAVFGERVLVFCKSLQYDVVSKLTPKESLKVG
ncbi:MAG: hypothetical protein NT114_00835 [Patescibacteria group bacterium]|jgi:hypothetical protein|nr:hypothetical protein [Patescibacteria group bacterium]